MKRDDRGGWVVFERFVREHAGGTREDFVRAFPMPILVRRGIEVPDGPVSFTTVVMERPTSGSSVSIVEVAPVRKTNRLFEAMITLGRAANNDIVLAHESVSKFHAFFVRSGAMWAVVDAQSTNGTFVEGRRLEPNVPCAVRLGAGPIEIRLGSSNVLALYDPSAFYDMAGAAVAA